MTARRLELYGARFCVHTTGLREHLAWSGEEFVEYDVERDAAASERLERLTPGARAVPVLVVNGVVDTIGWLGRSCIADPPAKRHGPP